MGIKKLAIMLVLALAGITVKAQDVALKTNLLYDATLNADLGIEFGLAPKWSLDITGNYNAWPIKEHTWKHWWVMPELRLWLCDRFAGSFFGLHAVGGQYNVGNLGDGWGRLSDHRYQGWGAGGGISYGYAWILGKHWNMEAEIGVGYVHFKYDKYRCATCDRKVESDKSKNYIGPTKAALNLVYIF